MTKLVGLFLIAMVAVALFGRLRRGINLGKPPKSDPLPRPGKCPDCGRYLIGKGPCDCKDRDA